MERFSPKGERESENPPLTPTGGNASAPYISAGDKKDSPLTLSPGQTADANESTRDGGRGDGSPLTLCHYCGQPFTPSRRGSPQRFCKPSHRVAAFQKAKRRASGDRPHARRTRRTKYPNGCWREAWECLCRFPGCICRRCLYNECHCWVGLDVSRLGVEAKRPNRNRGEGAWHESSVLY
jgi:hypothetical protein